MKFSCSVSLLFRLHQPLIYDQIIVMLDTHSKDKRKITQLKERQKERDLPEVTPVSLGHNVHPLKDWYTVHIVIRVFDTTVSDTVFGQSCG